MKSGGNEVGLRVDDLLNDHNVGRYLPDEPYERYEAGDQVVDGRPCQAYLLMRATMPNLQKFRDEKRRFICLFDDRSRAVQMTDEVRVDEAWTVQSLRTMKYDEPIEPILFEPHFGDGVTVMNLDSAVEGFVDLDKALHREERNGFACGTLEFLPMAVSGRISVIAGDCGYWRSGDVYGLDAAGTAGHLPGV